MNIKLGQKQEEESLIDLVNKYPLLNQLNDLAILDIVIATSERDMEAKAKVEIKGNIDYEDMGLSLDDATDDLIEEVKGVKKYIFNEKVPLKPGLFPMSVALRALPISTTAVDMSQALHLQQQYDQKIWTDPFSEKRFQVFLIAIGFIVTMVLGVVILNNYMS